MGRHDAGGAWDQRADAELIRAVRQWHESHPVPPLPAEYLGRAWPPIAAGGVGGGGGACQTAPHMIGLRSSVKATPEKVCP